MNRLSRAAILAAYRDGITVICELAVQFSDAAWLAPTPCAEWRAVDLAGHLRCVADDYHEYLDDAPDSRLARLMATGAPAESLAGSWPGRTRRSWPPCRTVLGRSTSPRSPNRRGPTAGGCTACGSSRTTGTAGAW